MSVYRSIAKNYAANMFGTAIHFLNQIALVPMFISFWGVAQYADWLLVTAFSSFFAMSDVGLVQASTNEFIMSYHRQEYDRCAKLIVNMFAFIVVAGLGFVLLSYGIISLLGGIKQVLGITVFSRSDASYIFILLLVQVFIKMYGSVYGNIYRATSNTHKTLMIDNIVRLSELLILFCGLCFKVDIVLIVTLYIIPIIVSIVYKHFDSRRWFEFSLSWSRFDFPLLRSLMKPSVAFMAIPVGYALQNQGMIFVVNAIFGPMLLVSFTTTRTVVNFTRSLMNMLGNAIWPEFSVAYGKGDINMMKAVYFRAFIITVFITVLTVIFLVLFGRPLYLWWTHHEVVFDTAFFYGMLVLLLISCIWGCAAVVLSSTNRHMKYSLFFMFSIAMGLVLSYMALQIYPHLSIIPFVLIPVELVLTWFILHKTNQLLGSDRKDFWESIFRESTFILKHIKSIKIGLK